MSNHNYSQYSNKNNNQHHNHNQNKPKPVVKTPEPVEVPVAKTPEVVRPAMVQETTSVVRPAVVQETTSVVRPAMVKETVETVSLPKTVEGVVAGCAKLNVRAEPSLFAEIVDVLDVSSELEIYVEESDKDWFKICTATGIEGYCMRKFVEACL